MPPPISSSGQAERSYFPPHDAHTIINTIGEGVNSHRIKFQLEHMPQVAEVQTVVGASSGERSRVNDAIENLKPRLLELYKNGSSLVSFGSSNSFNRIQKMHNQSIRANSSSLIEQILAAFNKPQLEGIPLSDTVTLKSIAIDSKADVNKLSFHGGTITFTKKGEPDREIMFQELCPAYDGKTLTSETLLAALKHVPETNASVGSTLDNKTKTAHPQFYSARGIGRSASLAVLYSFKEMCTQKNGFDPNEVMQHLGALIEQGRAQRNKHFVNTKEQEDELLKACEQINNETKETRKRMEGTQRSPFNHSAAAAFPAASTTVPPKVGAVPKPAHTSRPEPPPKSAPAPKPGSASVVSPALHSATTQPVRSVNKAIEDLALFNPTIGGIPDGTPYMPINVDGITKLASKDEFQLPTLTAEEAGKFATDIYKAGFYGDALGADLESHFYVFPPGITDRLPPRKEVLEDNLVEKKEYRARSTTQERKDEILIAQLKKHNGGGHGATDDTQQGALSAVAKMAWIKDGKADLNELARKTLATFRTPAFPNHPQNPTRTFRIRGAASTLRMCQDKTRHELEWRDVAIYDFDKKGQICRAGGAGNGGIMRIGYDLLPVLTSGATTQDLVKQILISNQVTHPSSFSAVACVGQVMLMAKCINLRLEAEKNVGKKLEIPQNFFINTLYDVASELEHPDQLFRLDDNAVPIDGDPYWRTERLPSEFLKGRSTLPNNPTQEQLDKAKSVNAGSVQTALEQNKNTELLNSIETAAVLQRWNSRSYLGATFPTVVFLLEKFGYDNPSLAVNMAALVTKDSDTCATIIAQVMGALHGSDWVNKQLASCRDDMNKPTFNDKLGGGFTLDNLITHTHNFYNERENQKKSQRSPQ